MSELVPLSDTERAIAEIETPADAKELYDKLETLSQYAKRYGLDQEKQNQIADAKLKTARIGGELLSSRKEWELPEGLSWAMSSRWQAIRPDLISNEEYAAHVEAIKKAKEELTLSGVLALARRLAGGVETPPLPDEKYRTIVADPPWPYASRPVRPDESGPRAEGTTALGATPFPYPTLPVEEIAALPIKERAADDAHLYLWTTNRFLEASYDVARGWGFKPSTLLVWCKKPMGILGGTFTITTEYVLFARRGQLRAEQHVDTTAFHWKRTAGHSVKPDEFFALVEATSPGPYLELFARRRRPHWVVWGNEVQAA